MEVQEEAQERDAVDEPEVVAPPREEEQGCAELEDWKADDEFELTRQYHDDYVDLTRRYYEARLPLAVEDCGVFAVRATMTHYIPDDENHGSSLTMETQVQVCNRCDEDAELLWIGSSGGLVESEVLRDLGARPDLVVDVESLDHTVSDGDTAHEFDISRQRLGPVVFVQPHGQDVISTVACRFGTYVFPDTALITRYSLAPGRGAQYAPSFTSFPSGNTDRLKVCDESQCPTLTHSNAGELKAEEVRFSIAWPRLRPAQADIEWESATFLHDSACLEAGLSLQYHRPGGSSGSPLHQEEKPTRAHWENHFVQKFTMKLPLELVEVIQGGVGQQEDE